MANTYTQAAGITTLTITKNEYEELKELLLDEHTIGDEWHGMSVAYYEGECLLLAENDCEPDALTEAFLLKFGELIAANDKLFYEVGVAYACDKMCTGGFGGAAFRIWHDGEIEWARRLWFRSSEKS